MAASPQSHYGIHLLVVPTSQPVIFQFTVYETTGHQFHQKITTLNLSEVFLVQHWSSALVAGRPGRACGHFHFSRTKTIR